MFWINWNNLRNAVEDGLSLNPMINQAMRFALSQPLASLEGPGLRRCVTLALLLHLLVIILFGSAPAGMALRGDGVWGRLSVSLTGAETPSKVPTASLEAYKRPQEKAQRPGGLLREADLPRAMAPPQAATAATPLEALNPENSERPGDAAAPALAALPELPQLTAMPSAALPAQSTLVPPTAALRRLSSESIGRPRVERAAKLSAIGTAAEQSVQPITPDLPVADSAKPITPARIVTLSDIAAMPTSRQEPVQTMAPAASEPAVAKLAPLQPLQPLEGNTPPLSPTGSLAGATPHLPGPGSAEAKPAPAAAPPVATAPLAPRLNLNLPRGGETSRGASQGLLQMLPRPPERPSRMADEVAKAAKKDCRQAYSGMGLLAVVPLVAGAVKGDGCNW